MQKSSAKVTQYSVYKYFKFIYDGNMCIGLGITAERKYGRCDFHLADNFVIFDVNITFS